MSNTQEVELNQGIEEKIDKSKLLIDDIDNKNLNNNIDDEEEKEEKEEEEEEEEEQGEEEAEEQGEEQGEEEAEEESEEEAEEESEEEAEEEAEEESEEEAEKEAEEKEEEEEVIGNKNTELHNLFKNNINNFNFDKDLLYKTQDNLHNKKDVQYFLNAVELLNHKLINENSNEIIEKDGKTYRMDYLYPNLDDKFLNFKISKKKEFSEYKQKVNINKNIEEESEKLCNKDFELVPHQNFVKNFLSEYTPYNGILLYHGLGTGKTCSAIGIAEETRRYMKYNGFEKQILIIASPNVQINFRLQLFDENKLENINDRWVINNCAGQNILDEINSLQSKIPRNKVIKLVDNIINNYYNFLGYIEFANLIIKLSNINNILKENPKISKKKQKLLIKNKLEKFFGNRLIIVDEIHNIRDTKDNSNKLVAKQFDNLVKNVDNMKLVFLSATPMFNDYKEIIFLINLLNANDNRSLIEVKDVFNIDGSFVTDENDNEVGKDLLKRKLNGYVSYVKGDNPFIFPYRILPELFENSRSIKNIEYPIYNIKGNRLEEDTKISLFDIYLLNLSEYQEKVYNYIINNTEYSGENDSYKYTLLLKPIEALNIVYPNPSLESSSLDEANSLKIDIKNLVGKSGLSNIMTYEENVKTGYRYNYRFKDEKSPNIFLRENIKKYSSKISNIIDSIENSKGPIIIYSQFIDGGLIPLALALESYGFKRYGDSSSLLEKSPVEELDIYSYKPKSQALKENDKFTCANYIMITGDKIISPNKEEELKACNDTNNLNGEIIKVILISSAGSEGLDFKYIRQIHIMEPWYNINRIEQILGRGVRTCSHKDLSLFERNVLIFMYASLLSNNTIETVDLLIYRKAEDKAKLIGNITKILKETSIDCHLNSTLSAFNEDKFSKLIDNELELKLSNNKIIKYKIGNKPFTALCDYMESCEYKCSPDIDGYTLKDDEEDNLNTYNDSYLETTNSKIIKLIKDLYKESYFYSKEEIITYININEEFSLLAVNNALDELVNNKLQTLTDKYNRVGHLINLDQLYIYQPLELDYENTSIFNRSISMKGIDNALNYEVPDIINNYKEKKRPEKDKSFKIGENILKDMLYNYSNIMEGNVNFVKKITNSKYNLLAFVINFNNKNDNILNYDLELLKDIILYILIDNLDINSYIAIFEYIYNTYEDYLASNSEYKDIVLRIYNYLNKNLLQVNHKGKILKGIIVPYPSDYDKFSLFILNKDDKVSLIPGEQLDYNRLNDVIKSKYVIDKSLYPTSMGFIDSHKNSDFYDLKIIHFYYDKKTYSNGRICNNFHTIEDKYNKFMHEFMTKEIYDNLNKKYKLGKYICVIAELYFRYFDLINKDNKKWFMSMNHGLINDKIKISKEK